MRSPAWARQAMVATSSPLAVRAALEALAEGGTAVDAAIASDAVLGVVQPMSTGVGGDAFALVDDGAEVAGFNGSGAAPAALTADACRAEGAWHDRSPLTVTVPGAVDAWAQLAGRYGRLGLARLLEPARQLAAGGFPAGVAAAEAWRDAGARLGPGAGLPPAVTAGQRVGSPDLAGTLAAVAAGGAEAHYTGAFARAAVDVVARAGGVLAAGDLAAHRGEWVDPLVGAYRGRQVLQLPPNGQGAAVLAALRLLDREAPGPAHDPDAVVARLLAVRRGMEAAYAAVADPRFAAVPAFWAGDTVLTAVRAAGMTVALVSSVYYGFGSGLVAGGSPLQNRGFGFSLEPGHPNVVAGGKRPFHTIIPGLVREDGRTTTAYGVIGASMQPQGHVQVLSHLLDHGADAQAALARPRFFWLGGLGRPDHVALEDGFSPAVPAALAAAGYRVVRDLPGRQFGVGQVVRAHADGWLEGGSDPRHDGVAMGR